MLTDINDPFLPYYRPRRCMYADRCVVRGCSVFTGLTLAVFIGFFVTYPAYPAGCISNAVITNMSQVNNSCHDFEIILNITGSLSQVSIYPDYDNKQCYNTSELPIMTYSYDIHYVTSLDSNCNNITTAFYLQDGDNVCLYQMHASAGYDVIPINDYLIKKQDAYKLLMIGGIMLGFIVVVIGVYMCLR